MVVDEAAGLKPPLVPAPPNAPNPPPVAACVCPKAPERPAEAPGKSAEDPKGLVAGEAPPKAPPNPAPLPGVADDGVPNPATTPPKGVPAPVAVDVGVPKPEAGAEPPPKGLGPEEGENEKRSPCPGAAEVEEAISSAATTAQSAAQAAVLPAPFPVSIGVC